MIFWIELRGRREYEVTGLYLVPALQHDVVESRGTALGLLHPEPVLHLVQDLQHHPVNSAGVKKINPKNYPENLNQRRKITFLRIKHLGSLVFRR